MQFIHAINHDFETWARYEIGGILIFCLAKIASEEKINDIAGGNTVHFSGFDFKREEQQKQKAAFSSHELRFFFGGIIYPRSGHFSDYVQCRRRFFH